MKKHQFFSVLKGKGKGEAIAKRQNGYTDGEYNYYNAARGVWHCIEPNTGLSVATGRTRQDAQQRAQAYAETVEAFKNTAMYRQRVEQFRELRYKAKIETR